LTEARRELRETHEALRVTRQARDDLVASQARLEAEQAALAEQLTVAEAARAALVAEERALRHTLATQEGIACGLQARLAAQESLYGDLARRLDALDLRSAAEPSDENPSSQD